MKPGESILKTLRRLGKSGGKTMSASQRWKAKRQKQNEENSSEMVTETEEEKQKALDKEKFLKLTGLADRIMQTGNMDAYDLTFEKITFEKKKLAGDSGSGVEESPKAAAAATDVLDMFAESTDAKSKQEKETDVNGMSAESGKESPNKGKYNNHFYL